MQTFTLKIVELRKETRDTITVCFKQPALKKIQYLPGQYLTLIFRINGRRYIRPYSFSSAPGVDPHLEITVKRVPGGVVSNHICDKVQVGDIIEVLKPMGDFIFDANNITNDKHIVLWGAGSGITPLMSIAKYVLHKNTGHKITLAYGNRHQEDVIFYDTIKSLEQQFADRLNTWHFYTKLFVDSSIPNVVQGRIDPHKLLSTLQSVSDLKNTIHYICGPVGLKESVKAALSSLGVAESNVYSEDFEIVKDEKDFVDISTQYVDLNIGGEAERIEVVKGKSILEAGLDALIELPYACQTGHCTLCKATIRGGKVKTIGLDKLPEDLLPGECLMCCAYPLTEDVQLTI